MITSIQNAFIKTTKKLHMKKYRDQEDSLLIEGFHLIEEAEKAKLIKTILLTKPHPDYPEATLTSPHVLKHLLQVDHQPQAAAIIKKPKPDQAGKQVLILENIQDPGNVGTLIRSALAFGFDTVVSIQSADIYSLKVLRSTQGAIFKLNIHISDIQTFKTQYPNHTLIGAHLGQKASLTKRPVQPFALVLGNEGQGLSKETIAQLDDTITIPIENIDSLNVGVAGSIIMHAITQTQPLLRD